MVIENDEIFIKLYVRKKDEQFEVKKDEASFCDNILIDNKKYFLSGNYKSIMQIIDELNINVSERITLDKYMLLIREIEERKIQYIDNVQNRINEIKDEEGDFNVKGLKANLFLYQKIGCKWLSFMVKNQCGCILGDDMGLGKTIQIIALFGYELEKNRDQVDKELPEKIEINQPIIMEEKEALLYEEERTKIVENPLLSMNINTIQTLRMFCTHPVVYNKGLKEINPKVSNKFCRLCDILEEIFANGEKVLIFTSFNEMIKLLCNYIPLEELRSYIQPHRRLAFQRSKEELIENVKENVEGVHTQSNKVIQNRASELEESEVEIYSKENSQVKIKNTGGEFIGTLRFIDEGKKDECRVIPVDEIKYNYLWESGIAPDGNKILYLYLKWGIII